MGGSNNPSMPGRRLARELKRLREATQRREGKQLTQKNVGDYVGCPDTTISKIETAERVPPEPHLKLMLLRYGVQEAHAAALMELAKQAREPGWWKRAGLKVPDWFDQYLGLEIAASGVDTYESEYVPGLLQTQRYIEAISTARSSNNSEAVVAVRAARQQRTLGNADFTLRTVLNEAVLRRVIGSPEVMREQLAYLREAMERPGIDLRVVPFSAGAHPGMTGPFTILRYPESDMDAVFVELRGDAQYPDEPKEVQEYNDAFAEVSRLALDNEGTVSLLREAERRH